MIVLVKKCLLKNYIFCWAVFVILCSIFISKYRKYQKSCRDNNHSYVNQTSALNFESKVVPSLQGDVGSTSVNGRP
jgi:hypothetical protein